MALGLKGVWDVVVVGVEIGADLSENAVGLLDEALVDGISVGGGEVDADGAAKDKDGDETAEDGDLDVVEGLLDLAATGVWNTLRWRINSHC